MKQTGKKFNSMLDVEFMSRTQNRLLVVYGGEVLDITGFAQKHPGGSAVLTEHKGKSVDNVLFNSSFYKHSQKILHVLTQYKIGYIDESAQKQKDSDQKAKEPTKNQPIANKKQEINSASNNIKKNQEVQKQNQVIKKNQNGKDNTQQKQSDQMQSKPASNLQDKKQTNQIQSQQQNDSKQQQPLSKQVNQQSEGKEPLIQSKQQQILQENEMSSVQSKQNTTLGNNQNSKKQQTNPSSNTALESQKKIQENNKSETKESSIKIGDEIKINLEDQHLLSNPNQMQSSIKLMDDKSPTNDTPLHSSKQKIQKSERCIKGVKDFLFNAEQNNQASTIPDLSVFQMLSERSISKPEDSKKLEMLKELFEGDFEIEEKYNDEQEKWISLPIFLTILKSRY